MGRPSQLIRIPLAEGVRTFADPFTIGAQPRLLQNLTHRLDSTLDGYPWRFPTVADPTQAHTYTITDVGTPAAGSNTLQFLSAISVGQLDGDGLPRVYVGGIVKNSADTVDQRRWTMWDLLADEIMDADGILMDGTLALQQGRIIYWPSQSAFYGAQLRASGTKPLKITRSGGSGVGAGWTTAPGGIVYGMIQHLDRIFLSQARDTTIFTDPFDDTTIRSTSSITTPGLDEITAYARPSVGDIDASIAAHLLIFGYTQVWSFDGDPQFGNAALRQLSNSYGCPAQTLVTETPHGAIFLGSDGRFHLIPPGATQLDPAPWPEIADAIRDQIDAATYSELILTNYPGTLVWHLDRLYWFPGTKTGHYELDFTRPTNPIWTGPHTSRSDAIMGAIVQPPHVALSGQGGLYVCGQNSLGASTMSATATTRAQKVRTGFLWTPGHDAIVRRVLVTTYRKTSAAALTVTLYKDDGTSVACKVVDGRGTADAPATTTVSQAATKVVTTAFAPLGGALRSSAAYLEVTAANDTELDLVRLEVEIEPSGRQQ